MIIEGLDGRDSEPAIEIRNNASTRNSAIKDVNSLGMQAEDGLLR